MTLTHRLRLLGPIAVVCVALDQITKAVAKKYLTLTDLHSLLGDTVRLQLAHNRGAFLSLGDALPEVWRQSVFTVGVGVLLLALLIFTLRAKTVDRYMLIALVLIVSGGASNLADRLIYGGYVVDFVQVGIGWLRTGVFNVADMVIMAGTFLLLFDVFRKRGPAAPDSSAPGPSTPDPSA